MKRKIGIIIAILLCVVMVFTFVACGNNSSSDGSNSSTNESENNGGGNGGGNGGTNTDPSTTTSTVSEAQQTEMKGRIETYIASWVDSHAQAEDDVTDQSAVFTNGLSLEGFRYIVTNEKGRLTPLDPTFNVTFDEATETYTIVASWKGVPSQTFTVKAKTMHYAEWAGRKISEYDPVDNAGDALDAVVKAGIHTANVVTGNVPTGKFSTTVTIGGDVAGHAYGLTVKGNVDIENPTNTELGIVVVNADTGKEFVGIYYMGAADPADAKIYLRYQDNFIYMDYTDFSSLIGMIPTADATDGVIAKYEGQGLNAFLGDYSSMISNLIGLALDVYDDEDGNYLFDINLGNLLANVGGLASIANLDLGSVLADYGFGFLNDFGLDLEHISGLQGHISIAVDMTKDDDGEAMIGGVELAINIPTCTLVLNDEATDADEALTLADLGLPFALPDWLEGFAIYKNSNAESDKMYTKIDIPATAISLYVDPFVFSTEENVEVLSDEAAASAKYFSVGNIDTSLDVTVNGYTYRAHLVTDINPFEIWQNKMNSNARVALVIRASEGNAYVETDSFNFLTITYEQEYKTLCVSGTFFNCSDNGETIYKLELTDLDDVMAQIKKWVGLDNWQGIGYSDEDGFYVSNEAIVKDSAVEILGLPMDLGQLVLGFVSNYGKDVAEESVSAGEDDSAEESAPSIFSDITGYVDIAKALYEEVMEFYKTELEGKAITIGDGSFSADVDPEVINKVTAFINAKIAEFGATFEIPETSEPELVMIRYNVEGYENTFYAKVIVFDTTYELTAGANEGVFTMNFTLTKESGRAYIFDFSADGSSVTFGATIKPADSEETKVLIPEITLSNFSFSWGWDTTETIENMLPERNAETGALDAELIFKADGTGPATALVHGISKNLVKYAEQIAMIMELVSGSAAK